MTSSSRQRKFARRFDRCLTAAFILVQVADLVERLLG